MENNSKQNETRLRMRLHEGLPRQGPGSDEMTADALRLLPEIPSPSTIYDLGCGPGRASIILAGKLKQPVIAVDLQEEFLRQLRDAAREKGLSHLIETRCGDMIALDDAPGTIDLIWSEGAIYCAGFDRALKAWRPLLTANGLIACTELSWLTAQASPEVSAFWQRDYPAMRSVVQNISAAEQLGYSCIAHFIQPLSCWWDEYYNPWLRHLDTLKTEAEQDDGLREMIDEAFAEIDLFRRFNHEYGYQFYLLQKSDLAMPN